MTAGSPIAALECFPFTKKTIDPRNPAIRSIIYLLPALIASILQWLLLAGCGEKRSTLAEITERGTIRIAIHVGLPPYAVLKPDGSPEGYEIDLGRLLAESLGVEPEWIVVDTPGRITALQTGKADVTIANFTTTAERSRVIGFTDPYLVVGMVFFVLAGRDDLQTVADLNQESMTIGFGRGSTQEQIVPTVVPNAKLARFSGMSDTADALNTGRIDAAAQDNIGTQGFLAANPGKYRLLEGIFSREDIALGLPAGSDEWRRVLNDWVRDFTASGKNREIFQKWFGFEPPQL